MSTVEYNEKYYLIDQPKFYSQKPVVVEILAINLTWSVFMGIPCTTYSNAFLATVFTPIRHRHMGYHRTNLI